MIPFVDLKAQYQSIKEEIGAAIAGVLESSQFVLGDEVMALEEEFAAYCGARYGVAVNSGTSALHLALLSAGVGPGDEVVTVSATFVATAAAVCYTGACPVFVDIDPHTLTMDVERIEEAITPRTKAILPVHLYGQPADMDPIMEIARRHQLVVIEDAAQAHGATYRGRRVGSLGHMACFSFYPSKNLGAYGEGGMVVTNDPVHARILRMLRDWGKDRQYHHLVIGYNYRMSGLQGAILRVKLRYLDEWTQARQRYAAQYLECLAGSNLCLPTTAADRSHVYHIFAVRTPNRDALQQVLREAQIQTGVHYPTPVHLQPAFADYDYDYGDLPVTERLFEEELSLPMYAELPPDAPDRIAAAVRRWQAAPVPRIALVGR